MKNTATDEVFTGLDFTGGLDSESEYINCTFENCNFASADLSHATLIDCRFTGCDLHLAKVAGTSLTGTILTECNCMGINFFECNRFMLSLSFEKCNLNLSSFYELDLHGMTIILTSLKETDFTGSNLSSARIFDSSLEGTIFSRTDLSKTDFSGSSGFTIDPSDNLMKGAMIPLSGVEGLLLQHGIILV